MNAIRFITRLIPDRIYISLVYYKHFKRLPNLKSPKTFNEKLQWLKLYDFRDEYTIMADKLKAKEYVANKIGSKYVVPLLGAWKNANDINIDMLPNQFVLKTNHDSHTVIICDDKKSLDKKKMITSLNRALKKNGYWYGREKPYKNITPMIIAEEYLKEENETTLTDYKVLCFNGKAQLIEVHKSRFTKNYTQDFYDRNWHKMNFSQEHTLSKEILPKPVFLEEMIEKSELLSSGMKHLRVDWYYVNGRLYFGELTFYDGAGFTPFDDPIDDLLIGEMLSID